MQGFPSLRAFALLLCCVSAAAQEAAPPASAPPIPTPPELEAHGAVIGEIRFENQDIFDESDPRENYALYRLANDLHIKSRESTLRAQLLFKEGDPYSWRLIRETERNMRRLDYLFDVQIRTVSFDGSRVGIVVATRDVWSLQPGFTYSRKGGQDRSGFSLEEENLFGYGKNLIVGRSRDEERKSTTLAWRDPNVWGSRWRDALSYADSDDGHLYAADFDRPFFSLDTRWSAGFGGLDQRRVDPRYDLGEVVDEFRHEVEYFDARGGISPGLVDGWTRRWVAGYRYDRQRFAVEPGRLPPISLPPDRTLSYPWVGLHLIEDEYTETVNFNQIGRTEDVYYGTSYRFELGYSAESFGATNNSALFSTSAGTGVRWGDDGQYSLFLNGGASGRVRAGAIEDGLFGGTVRYYWRWDPKRVLYASLDGIATDNLDPEDQILMGGDSDLRGYPFAYQAGTSRMQFTVEQRFYTDWFPLRLFNVGGAVFFDAGRVWGRGIGGTEPRGWLKNAGFGLRLGNARSGFGSVIHLDVAFALDADETIDEVQFIVETKRSF
ncbi:MAG TPA: BamA/TamA family outer membrane protein [Steroidobacteraceae bacterium]|nr:BamA/TamA family outer membrane protein [Steroidobacteraceae bacterium]